LFALGAALSEMSGTKAFEGKSRANLVDAIRRGGARAACVEPTLVTPGIDRV
jgi:hypothetical protein